MNYIETRTYRDMYSRIENEINSLMTERLAIMVVKKKNRTLEAERKQKNLQNRIKTKEKQRDVLINIVKRKRQTWNIVHLIMAADGTLWNETQVTRWHKALSTHEGRGEESLRDWYGLPLIAATTEDCDLPEIDTEAKNVQGRGAKGRFNLQMIQAGKHGRDAFMGWAWDNNRDGLFKDLPIELQDCLKYGEVSSGTLHSKLPVNVRDSLYEATRPSKVFERYKAIDCTTRNGFLHIPSEDFDKAWSFSCITKCGPKYALLESYLKERLLETQNVAETKAFIHLRTLRDRVFASTLLRTEEPACSAAQ
jgi:hypothetical protein